MGGATGAAGALAAVAATVTMVAVRGAVLLVGAAIAVALLRGRSAARRHAVWAAALGVHLVLLAFSGALPAWRVTVPPALAPVLSVLSVPPVRPSGLAPTRAASAPRPARHRRPHPAGARAWHSVARPSDRNGWVVGWAAVWATVWAAGAGVLCARGVLAHRARARLARTARRVVDARWVALAAEAAADVGLRRPIALLRLPPGHALAIPVTWGVRRPVVLLPPDADTWGDARRRRVLLHELAHAARGDVRVQQLAHLVAAVFWFDPLVWLAVRRLAAEAERAADDQVLRAGAVPSAYVADLVALARALRASGAPGRGPTRVPAGALGLVRVPAPSAGGRSAFAHRMGAALDPRADRRPLGRRTAALTVAGALAAALPLATARLADARAGAADGALPVPPRLTRPPALAWRHPVPASRATRVPSPTLPPMPPTRAASPMTTRGGVALPRAAAPPTAPAALSPGPAPTAAPRAMDRSADPHGDGEVWYEAAWAVEQLPNAAAARGRLAVIGREPDPGRRRAQLRALRRLGERAVETGHGAPVGPDGADGVWPPGTR